MTFRIFFFLGTPSENTLYITLFDILRISVSKSQRIIKRWITTEDIMFSSTSFKELNFKTSWQGNKS